MNIKSKIKNLFKPGETLSQKVVRSTVWVGFSKIVERILRFIRTIIVARLLSPADFGLFGIACLAMDILQTFTETGTNSALIQKKERIEEYLDTAWTIRVIRSIVLFAALFFFSPLVARFFNNPGASGVTKAVAFTVLFSGFSNIGTIYFSKDIDFRKEFILQIAKILSNSVVTIVLAFILKNTWALIWGMLAGSLTQTIMSYVIHPYRPKFKFESEKAKELFTFGRWIFISTITLFFIMQGDDILVGRILGTTALGLYTMAYAISNLAATEVTHLISQITFPAYSKLQDNIPKLREAYMKTLQITVFISLPIACGVFIFAPEFTKIFLGEKWMSMVPAMQVLCIFGAVRSINATIGPIIDSSGKPKIQTKLTIIQLVIMSLLIYPLTIKWGILGTSWAVTVPNILILFLVMREAKNIILVPYKDFIMTIMPAFVSSLTVLLILFLSYRWFRFDKSMLNFFGAVFLSASAYILIISFWKDIKERKILGMLKTILNNV